MSRGCLLGVMALLLSLVLGGSDVSAATGAQLLQAGNKALQQGRYDQAVKLLQEAAKTLSHWGAVHFSLAQAMRFRGDPAASIAIHVKQATRLMPNNPSAHFFAGQFWESEGKAKPASHHYERAIKLGYPSAAPCVRLARLYIAAKQGPKALHCLEQLRTKGQLIPGLYALLAQARALSGQIFLAGQDWLIAQSRQPNNLALLQRVFIFFQQYTPQQKGETKRAWEQALARLQKRIRQLLPPDKRRRLRMLRPSRNQQR